MQRGRVQGLLFPHLYFLLFLLQLVTLFSHGGGLLGACSRPQVQWSPEDPGYREQCHSGRRGEGAVRRPEEPELCVADTWVSQCFFFPFILVTFSSGDILNLWKRCKRGTKNCH